ncbi:predicted protein [Chaetoceros tenuissimus]|uniref:Uncharacterized protein n=1 Tax=Chaetoceros tenuissimus TaxID=426638 RepID=A0AAD3D5P5_9STRA|nr:predicted protein [Chaetoceros tenuissimus]
MADTIIRIEEYAFIHCRSLTYIKWSTNLEFPQNVELAHDVFTRAKFLDKSPFPNTRTSYEENCQEIHAWMKNINNHEDYALHRACSSYQPLKEVIMSITEKKGLQAFKVKNEMGITPSQYLKENPYRDIKEKDIIESYIMKMMGENIDIE